MCVELHLKSEEQRSRLPGLFDRTPEYEQFLRQVKSARAELRRLGARKAKTRKHDWRVGHVMDWLENRKLLATTVISLPATPRDIVYDNTRNLLYASESNGTVARYSVATKSLFPAWTVGGALNGLDITADQYPYVAGATSLGAAVPPWSHEGGTAKLVERLKDPATREKLKQEMRTPSNNWENFYLGAGGGEGILISSVLNRELAKYEGKRINEVARMMGKKDEIDALFDLLIADNAQTSMIVFLMSEDDVKLALRQPWVSVGVDHGAVAITGPLAEGKAHPRGYGSFPRILGRYVRDEHLVTLEEAIRKMTSLAANRVHLVDRGLLDQLFVDQLLD